MKQMMKGKSDDEDGKYQLDIEIDLHSCLDFQKW